MNKTEQIYLRETRTKLNNVDELWRGIEDTIDKLEEAVSYQDEAAGFIGEAEIAMDKLHGDMRSFDPDMAEELEIYQRQINELADDADQAHQALDKIRRAFKEFLK